MFRIAEFAGAAGLTNYKDLTLAEIVAYGRGREKTSWQQASFIAAYALNSKYGLKRFISPSEIDPTAKKEAKHATLEEVVAMMESR